MQGVTENTNGSGVETELCFATARELVERVRRREISVREVVQAHLDRIERVDPQVNAVVTVTPDRALDEAAAADELLAAGHEPGPLFGLPIAHKDTHLTAGIRTTFGSQSMRDFVPDNDELIVERIRAAGAITIGKTNVPEFGAGSHTFNTIFGATRNPYDVARSAGGSSGGAAAALASGMHAIADGSDMGGSLRNPAAFCNVVGLRPSPGRVPSYPSNAAWATMAVQGPMARTVSDTALLLSVIGGPDPRCPISLPEPGDVFARPLERDLSGLRVAWSPDLGGSVPVDSAVTATLLPQVAMFESLGCVVEEACPDFTGADEVFRTLRAWQFELMLGTLANTDGASLKPSLMWNIEQGRRLTGRDIAAAEVARTALYHRFREFFERYDILLLPVSQVPPFDADLEYPREIAGIRQDTYLDWMRSAYYVSATGHPALSVPGGFTVDGLPVGLQIVGPHHGDLDVLQVGYAFEQATHFGQRRPDNLTTGVAHD
jgi:amidase